MKCHEYNLLSMKLWLKHWKDYCHTQQTNTTIYKGLYSMGFCIYTQHSLMPTCIYTQHSFMPTQPCKQ